MGFSSVVYAFVLLNLVDGALAQKPNVTTYMSKLQQRGELISRAGESDDDYGGPHGQPFCDKYDEKWTDWSTSTIQDGWANIHGCSYESKVCATLSYELIDENADDKRISCSQKANFVNLTTSPRLINGNITSGLKVPCPSVAKT
jgi:hypothetical protein